MAKPKWHSGTPFHTWNLSTKPSFLQDFSFHPNLVNKHEVITPLRKQTGGRPEMSLTLALTLFSAVYSISLDCGVTLTYVFIQLWNSTGLFSSVIKKSNKSSKANCMVLTFALLDENSSNKTTAYKSFASCFGSERSDLMIQNYVNASGLQRNLEKKTNKQPQSKTFCLITSSYAGPFGFPGPKALFSMMNFHF